MELSSFAGKRDACQGAGGSQATRGRKDGVQAEPLLAPGKRSIQGHCSWEIGVYEDLRSLQRCDRPPQGLLEIGIIARTGRLNHPYVQLCAYAQ